MRKLVCLFAAALLLQCAAAQRAYGDELPVVTPRQLNANPDAYDRRYVRVRGYVVVAFEQRYLVEDAESYLSWPSDKVCISLVSYANPLSKRGPGLENMKMQVVTGVFIKDIDQTHVLYMGACNKTGIDLDTRPGRKQGHDMR
ncbi:hypothetical protein [Dyella sp. 2RAB6]|uniref:hypothetical protein n=1 Tax=Dyella sp. 2RAB6 TaxID=3232992 RepID=UPI003F91D599